MIGNIGDLMIDMDINFGAFVLSGVFAFLLGVVWYHPKVMGKQWLAAQGSKKAVKDGRSPLLFVSSFFLWLLSACFYAFIASFLQMETAAGYFALSCLLWVAFAMPPALMGALYTGYPFEAVAIDTSYQLGGYYVFATVHIIFLQLGML